MIHPYHSARHQKNQVFLSFFINKNYELSSSFSTGFLCTEYIDTLYQIEFPYQKIKRRASFKNHPIPSVYKKRIHQFHILFYIICRYFSGRITSHIPFFLTVVIERDRIKENNMTRRKNTYEENTLRTLRRTHSRSWRTGTCRRMRGRRVRAAAKTGSSLLYRQCERILRCQRRTGHTQHAARNLRML